MIHDSSIVAIVRMIASAFGLSILSVCLSPHADAKVPDPVFGAADEGRGALLLSNGSFLAADSSHIWRIYGTDGSVRAWPGLPPRSAATAYGRLERESEEEVLILTAGNRVSRYSISGESLGGIPLPIHDADAIALLPANDRSEARILAHSARSLSVVDASGSPIFSWKVQSGEEIAGIAWSGTRKGRLIAIAAGRTVDLVNEYGEACPGWPVTELQPFVSSPLFPIWDTESILCTDRLGRVHAWNLRGEVVSGWPFDTSTWNEHVELAAADWDWDGLDEIFVAVSEGYWVLCSDAAVWPGTPVYSRSARVVPPLVFNMDDHPALELIGGTIDNGTFALMHDGTITTTGWGEHFVPLLAGMSEARAVVAGRSEGVWSFVSLGTDSPAFAWTIRGGDSFRSHGRAAARARMPDISVRHRPDSTLYAGTRGTFEVLIRNRFDRPLLRAQLALAGRAGTTFIVPVGTIGPRDSSSVRFRASVPLVADSSESFSWHVIEDGMRFPPGESSEWNVSRNVPWTFADWTMPGPRTDRLELHDDLLTGLAAGVLMTTDASGNVLESLSAEADAFAWEEDALYHMQAGFLNRTERSGGRFVVASAHASTASEFLVLDSFFVFLDSGCAAGGLAEIVSRSNGTRNSLALPQSGKKRGLSNSLFAFTGEEGARSLVAWELPSGRLETWTPPGNYFPQFAVSTEGIAVARQQNAGFQIVFSPADGPDFHTVALCESGVPLAIAVTDSYVVWQVLSDSGSRIETARLEGGGSYRLAELKTKLMTPLTITSRRIAFETDRQGVVRVGDLSLPHSRSGEFGSSRVFRWGTPHVRGTAITISWEASELEPEDRFLVWRSGESGRQNQSVIRARGEGTLRYVDSGLPALHAGITREYGVTWFRGLTAIDSLETTTVVVAATIKQLSLVTNGGNPLRNDLEFSVRIPPAAHDSYRLELYDLRGRRLASRELYGGPGEKRVRFDSRRAGGELGSGIYFARLVGSEGVVASRKVVLLR